MEEENIELRYIKWNQRVDKLERDIKEFSETFDKDDFTLKPFAPTVVDFTTRLDALKWELDDIICWEEVEDFLQNGSGLKLDKAK